MEKQYWILKGLDVTVCHVSNRKIWGHEGFLCLAKAPKAPELNVSPPKGDVGTCRHWDFFLVIRRQVASACAMVLYELYSLRGLIEERISGTFIGDITRGIRTFDYSSFSASKHQAYSTAAEQTPRTTGHIFSLHRIVTICSNHVQQAMYHHCYLFVLVRVEPT